MKLQEAEIESFLDTVLRMGKKLVENGAEVRRAEDTVRRMVEAYGLRVRNVFALLSLAEITVESDSGRYYTQSVRILHGGNDLGEVERINSLARRVCEETPAPAVLAEWLNPPVQTHPVRRLVLDAVGYACTAGGFAVFFGAAWVDAVFAAMLGAILFLMDHFLDLRRQNRVIYTVVAGFLIGCAAEGLHAAGLSENPCAIMIGVIMLLVPTLAVINGAKEITNRDTVTGLARFTEAIIVTCAIGGGFGCAIALFGGGYVAMAEPSAAIQVIFGTVGACGFALYGHTAPKNILPILGGAAIGWAAYLLVYANVQNVFISTLVGAIAVGTWSELMARLCRAPASTFILPGLYPLLPGRALFETGLSVFFGNALAPEGSVSGFVYMVSGIVVGIVASSIFFGYIAGLVRHNKEKIAAKRQAETKTEGNT